MGFYDYYVLTPKGDKVFMRDFAGKVVLVVNTATGCGFTPQYEQLEKMYEKFHDKGLEIIDVPCNQFLGQAPGSDEEIHQFCTLHYKTQFTQMKKSDVNGENALPLFNFLKSQKGFKGFGFGKIAERMAEFVAGMFADYQSNDDIKWNFTKFLINRDGEVIARFEPTADMQEVENKVSELIEH